MVKKASRKAVKAAPKKGAKKKVSATKQAVGKPRTPKSVEASLTSLAKRINDRSTKNYGYTAAGEFYSDIVGWVSTGSTPLDVTLWGGFPRGRIIDIEGDPSQGKSTLMESVFVENQRAGGENVLLMSEACLDRLRMEREGMDISKLLALEIDTLEQGVYYIHDVLMHRQGLDPAWCAQHPLVLGWDTPSNAQEQHIFDDPDNLFGAGMASKARSVRSALRTIVPLAGRLNVTIMLLLQQHKKIGTPYAGSDVDCGGGPKFNASLRIKARQIERIMSPTLDDREVGIISSFEIIKSKAGCPPFRQTDSIIRAWDGIDNDASMFRFLRDSWLVDNCPTCGGKTVIERKGRREWESEAWRSCTQCNGTGHVFRILDKDPTRVCVEGRTESGAATQYRYIFGWPDEPQVTTTDSRLRADLDSRPGLRTWMAQQCWLRCSKPEPTIFHPVE